MKIKLSIPRVFVIMLTVDSANNFLSTRGPLSGFSRLGTDVLDRSEFMVVISLKYLQIQSKRVNELFSNSTASETILYSTYFSVSNLRHLGLQVTRPEIEYSCFSATF